MRTIGIILTAVLLVGCGNRDEPKQLFNLRTDGASGPDEFAVVSSKPLEIPDNIASQDLPQPGGTSRADINSQDLIAEALGGRPSAGFSDQAFVNSVSRFGVTENIRDVLAEEDEQFRANAFVRVLERAARVNVYYKTYERQSLSAYEELERLRRLGVTTPTAPPSE